MAGRGTDIKLGEGVAGLGGLHVIGSARHDSRRIDRQLRGRCSRQGDPGSTRFYISLEDDLMRLFGGDKIVKMMDYLGMEDGEALQSPILNHSVSTAQKRVEQHHFSIRKRTLEYDDVMNKQREVVYGFRKEALLTDDPREILMDFIEQGIEEHVDLAFATESKDMNFDPKYLLNWLNSTFPIGFTEEELLIDAVNGIPNREKLTDYVIEKIKKAYQDKVESEDDPEMKNWLERHIILEAIDRLWQEHLHEMDHLRSTISLRQYAQKDPLIEYKKEAFKMFNDLMSSVNQEILMNLFKSATSLAVFEELLGDLAQDFIHVEYDQFGDAAQDADAPIISQADMDAQTGEPIEIDMGDFQVTFRNEVPKVGRNEPCPCGSGKKYKKCCGN
jgi:preprotein translocase subunit SecA